MGPTIILKRPVPGANERALQRFTSRACKVAGLRGRITVLITGNSEIAALNARFRRKKKPTDVLSFPPPAFYDGFAGDIAISADIAARNARALGHSTADEIRVLILHGALHLAGYDHEADHGEMAEKERQLRRRLELPVSLIERSSSGRKSPMIRKSGLRRRTKTRRARSRV
jgi:probable rRNA maturation factor